MLQKATAGQWVLDQVADDDVVHDVGVAGLRLCRAYPDVFGEVGMLEGGKRMATVEVASADAEVLLMSQQNSHALLHQVPAFSFGIRATAAQRQERENKHLVAGT